MNAKMDANLAKVAKREKMLAEMGARMDANTKEMNANTRAIQERM
jgi:hypothetical protein